MEKKQLRDYFTQGLNPDFRGWFGSEVETHFVDANGKPISVERSQSIFRALSGNKWEIVTTKNGLITELQKNGARILYELGRQNIELATAPFPAKRLWEETQGRLYELYAAASRCGAFPLFEPIMQSDEDLLVIPDERDASWLELDGRAALAPLATTASLQFTIEARDPEHAIEMLNLFAKKRAEMLEQNPYPQETVWKDYIATSNAQYSPNRYGVVQPASIDEYVDLLAQHKVVLNGKLVPFEEADQQIDMFLRSVWWNFRLRRYKDRLCVEVRTLARRSDEEGVRDLQMIMSLLK
jgi:hypothetical protein